MRIKELRKIPEQSRFGRAGYWDGRNQSYGARSRDIGARNRARSSVASGASVSYIFGFETAEVTHSNSHANSYGFPLRCLVNSTVGE